MLSTVQLHCTSLCDHKCSICEVRSPYPGDADFDKVVKLLPQIAELGIRRYVDFTGGNPMLLDWLPEALNLSNCLGLLSSLTISGPMIAKRGAEIIGLPTILRLSIDGDENYHNNHGHGYYEYLANGLEMIHDLRRNKWTQLLFTILPGTKGNIRQDILSSVLNLAREFGVLVNINPEFGATLDDDEIELLLWFAKQADVQVSRGKIRFITRGGNNISNPTCRAVSSVIAISPDNKLVLPCFHAYNNGKSQESISLDNNSLIEALNSQKRRAALKMQGKYSFCHGCSRWCYIIPSWITLAPKRVVAWLHAPTVFQVPRDSILRLCGRFNTKYPYPSFRPKG